MRSGQSCTEGQLAATLACYNNVKSKLDGLFLEHWPESNVLPNITNALIADLCTSYAQATTCSHASICTNVIDVARLRKISDYICLWNNSPLVTKSDCVQNVRSSNGQSVAMCNYLTRAASAMKTQMSMVDTCYYYIDAASCAYHVLDGICGKDVAVAVFGLFNLVVQEKIDECSLDTVNMKVTLSRVRRAVQYDPMCNSGWTLYRNQCYIGIRNSSDQPNAEVGCRNSGGHLVTILSQTENDFVTQLGTQIGVKTFWTGLRWEINGNTGAWKWLSRDGATFFAWNTGQPINATAMRCIIVNVAASGLWETSQCYPQTADGFVCRTAPVDYCNPNPCLNGGTCSSTASGGSCTCAPGFTGVVCDQRVNTTSNACSSSPCLNGGTCTTNTNGSYQCTCPTGFTGNNCQNGTTTSSTCQPNPCQNGGTCNVVSSGRFTCTCPANFTGPVCASAVQLACSSSPCLNGATCTNTPNATSGYTCICPANFTGPVCASAVQLACSSSPCLNGATCTNTPNATSGYTCICPANFTGPVCASAIQLACSSNPCLNGGTCANTASGFTCACPANFTGPTCATAIQLACSSNPCLNGGNCTNTGASYTCTCPSPYSGANCQTGANVCASSPCSNGGTCSSSGSTSFACACVLGFTGTRCETNINECASSPCQNGGTCVDGVNEFSCKCTAGWSGATCNQQINNCQPNPCRHNGTCVTLSLTEYICKCADGWVGVQCEADNNECDYSPCSKNATCLNTPGSFRCICPAGVSSCTYSVSQWSTPSSVNTACSGNPCRNGGTCQVTNGGFLCTCAAGYTGTTCDTVTCDTGWQYNQGYCYTVVTTTNNITNAQFNCNQRAANLASFRSVDEENFIGRLLAAQKQDRAWIGARYSNGAWSWMDGTPWTYTAWYTGEPKSSSSSSCARIITGYGFTWDTKTCDTAEPSVCKKLASGSQNFCATSPCQNGGTCINFPDHYQCACTPTYSGTNCQVLSGSSCYPACQNGASCTNGACVCAQGYTGSTCGVACPNGWSWWISTCYFGVNTPMTYSQAVSNCPQQKSGSYLLTTMSQTELYYTGIMMNQMQSNVWLGMQYNPSQSQFVWITGSPLNSSGFTAWATGQPSSQQTRNCVRVVGYTGFVWETEDCTHTVKFICKYTG